MSVFHSKPTDTEPDRCAPITDLIPLSHLALDLEPPPEGWSMFLARRGIQVVPDVLGRDAIGMDAARRLLDEQRENVLRRAALLKVAEQAAVEQDQARRAQLGQGISAAALNGMSYAEAAQQAEAASAGWRPRASVLEDALGNGGMVFHPIRSEGDQ